MTWQQNIRSSTDIKRWYKLELLLEKWIDDSIKTDELINNYYLPLYFYLFEQKKSSAQKTFVIGINAPQGSGKTTLSSHLVNIFKIEGINAISLSIDDFYLTRHDQMRLAESNANVNVLHQRGYPGTHDIQLGVDILSSLKNPGNKTSIAIPRYDKSRHQGQGDRIEKHKWPSVNLPVDVVLLEGWMLGFQPIEELNQPQMKIVNSYLEEYKKWHQFLDCFLYIYPEDPKFVINWRCEAEERMKSSGLSGMTEIEVKQYAEGFTAAYKLYGPELYRNPPIDEPCLKIKINQRRLPVD
jgi:D-glycerate 3-kinase